MADLPEYKRQIPITPAGSSGSFSTAATGVVKSYEMLGDMGAGIAQNAAIEQATIEGIKAGQTPGRTLLPALGKADKAFVDAYKVEEYNTVARDAEQYFSSAYFEAAKNPSPQSLEAYKQGATKQIDFFSNLITESNRPKFKRDLESAADAKFYQLASALEVKNKHAQKVNYQLNDEQREKNIQTLNAQGLYEEAQREYREGVAYTNAQIGSEHVPTKAYADKINENRRQQYLASSEAYELFKAQEQGKEASYLAERAKEPATPDNLAIDAVLLKQQQMYASLKSMQSSIAQNTALELRNNGELTEAKLLDLESQMSPLDLSKYHLQVSKDNLKSQKSGSNVAYVKANAGNEIALSTASGESLDAAMSQDIKNFSELKGRPPELNELAAIAQSYQAAIPSFNKQLGAMISSKDAGRAIQGSAIYESLSQSNPRAVGGISKENEVKAGLINSSIQAGEDPNDAFNVINEKLANLRASDIEHRKAAFTEIKKIRELANPSQQETMIAKKMGYDKDIIPSGLYKDYMRNLESYYVISEDWDQANALAKKAIDRSYFKTTVNGYEQVMWLAPNSTLPFAQNEIYLKNLIINKANTAFEKQKALFDSGDPSVDHYYKLAPNVEALADEDIPNAERVGAKKKASGSALDIKDQPDLSKGFPVQGNQAIPVIEVDRSGKETPGTLYISSDSATSFPGEGKSSSYSLSFTSKGKVIPRPIYNPDNVGNNLRFEMTADDIKRANDASNIRKEAAYNQALFFQEINRKVREARDLLGESEYE